MLARVPGFSPASSRLLPLEPKPAQELFGDGIIHFPSNGSKEGG